MENLEKRKERIAEDGFKFVRYYKGNKKPIAFWVYDKELYMWGKFKSIEQAKKAITEYRRTYKNEEYFILEML